MWLLENCYMAIAFEVYLKTNTLKMLLLMFGYNVLLIAFVCFFGMPLLGQVSFVHVQEVVMAFVVVMQLLFWHLLGLRKALKGILVAQLCVCVTLIIVYLIYYNVN